MLKREYGNIVNMWKVLILVVFIFIGQTLAAGVTCSSCGSECVSACGTRRFRICCFNHLRRKRDFSPHQIEEVLDGDSEMVIQNAVVIIEHPELWWWGHESHSRMEGTN